MVRAREERGQCPVAQPRLLPSQLAYFDSPYENSFTGLLPGPEPRSPTPPGSHHHSRTGYGQEKGGVSVQLRNLGSSPLELAYFDSIPWQASVLAHTITVSARTADRSPVGAEEESMSSFSCLAFCLDVQLALSMPLLVLEAFIEGVCSSSPCLSSFPASPPPVHTRSFHATRAECSPEHVHASHLDKAIQLTCTSTHVAIAVLRYMRFVPSVNHKRAFVLEMALVCY